VGKVPIQFQNQTSQAANNVSSPKNSKSEVQAPQKVVV
jgi:hypothetical protein